MPSKQKLSLCMQKIKNKHIKKAVANAPVPVMANTNIKVPVDLKLQLRGHTSTLIFT